MLSTTSFFATTALAVVGCLTTHVQGHGYMYIPLTEFKGTATGAWIVQIAPQFQANWESVANDEELIALYVEKAKEAGYANNIRKLLDSDTNLYGANCGFSDPDAKAKDPPSDGTATFERGLAHHGPCEIWLDDTMVLHNDDCAKAFGVEDYMSIKSVFKPIDYSSCSSSGCMFRFYWLAFQGSTSGKYVWQIYKDCIPLTGPGAGKTSTAGASNTTQPSDTTQMETSSSNSLSTQTPEVQAQTPQVQTPSSTSAPSQTNAPTTENNTPEVQATQAPMATQAQWTPAPQTWNIPTQAPSTNAQPQVTNAPVWTNAPAAETPGTVAPFTQNQATPAPALNTATNTPNSYSFNNEGQNTNNPNTPNTPETNRVQIPSTTAPSFSF